jgi:hypothetical protein
MQRILLLVLTLLAATGLPAHEGHEHQVLGTVQRLRECHFVLKTQKGETKTIFLSPSTRYERAGQQATKQDLASGTRVSVAVEDDGETAVTVKLGGAK